MRFSLEVLKGDFHYFILRIPSTGLTLGSGEKGDIILPMPDDNSFLSFSPSGRGLTFRIKNGIPLLIKANSINSGLLRDGDVFQWGDYTFKVSVDQQNTLHLGPDAHRANATVQFDSGRGVLEMTHGSLAVVDGVDQYKTVPLDSDVLTVGTDVVCDLVLTDPYVSSRHCSLHRTPDGFILRDLESTNGTFIGEATVVEAVLKEGSEFVVGRTRLRLGYKIDRVEVSPIREDRYCGMIGRSDAMRRIFFLLEKVAPTNATVLLEGATGTGKELAARAIHQRSPRSSGSFVALNCAAIPRDLVESELFGHVKGAFSGASADRRGVFELADGGTLFLDEISELPLELQTKLLRVLEEGTFRKVGGESELDVEVRVVAATNKSLGLLVEKKQFRQDLFYRLAMIKIKLPSLNHRVEDIPVLAEYFLVQDAKALGLNPPPKFSEATLNLFKNHSWPGNVRELRNVINQSMILSGFSDTLRPEDIQLEDTTAHPTPMGTLEDIEKATITACLQKYPSRKEAAQALGIGLSTLYDKIKKYGLE